MWARAAVFFTVIAVLGWLSNIGVGRRYVVEPMTRVSVLATRALVNLFGADARATGTLLYSDDAALNVKDGCNGVIAMILFTGAIIAHRATASAKVLGLLLGIPAIWLVNLLRLVSLYVVSVVSPSNLEFFHIYFWQTLIIICVGILWYCWASWSLRLEA
jgi:exosortase/archaeosortase family protein